jgi:hypothetical protein
MRMCRTVVVFLSFPLSGLLLSLLLSLPFPMLVAVSLQCAAHACDALARLVTGGHYLWKPDGLRMVDPGLPASSLLGALLATPQQTICLKLECACQLHAWSLSCILCQDTILVLPTCHQNYAYFYTHLHLPCPCWAYPRHSRRPCIALACASRGKENLTPPRLLCSTQNDLLCPAMAPYGMQ